MQLLARGLRPTCCMVNLTWGSQKISPIYSRLSDTPADGNNRHDRRKDAALQQSLSQAAATC